MLREGRGARRIAGGREVDRSEKEGEEGCRGGGGVKKSFQYFLKFFFCCFGAVQALAGRDQCRRRSCSCSEEPPASPPSGSPVETCATRTWWRQLEGDTVRHFLFVSVAQCGLFICYLKCTFRSESILDSSPFFCSQKKKQVESPLQFPVRFWLKIQVAPYLKCIIHLYMFIKGTVGAVKESKYVGCVLEPRPRLSLTVYSPQTRKLFISSSRSVFRRTVGLRAVFYI